MQRKFKPKIQNFLSYPCNLQNNFFKGKSADSAEVGYGDSAEKGYRDSDEKGYGESDEKGYGDSANKGYKA